MRQSREIWTALCPRLNKRRHRHEHKHEYKRPRVLCPGLVSVAAPWRSGRPAVLHRDRDMELAALAHTRKRLGMTMGRDGARLSCWQLPPSPPSAPPPPPCSLPSLWLPQAPGHTTQDPGTQPSDAGCHNSGGHASRHNWQTGRLDWPRGHRPEPISEAWLGASAYLAPADWN